MARAMTVTVPDIGDYHDVPVIEVLVKDGLRVEKDQTLMVLESDKATLDVPAPVAGVVGGFKLKVGDKVSMGTAVCEIAGEAEAAAAPAEPAAAAPAAPAAPAAAKAAPSEEAVAPAAAAAPAASAGAIAVTIPDIGDYADVPVIEVLVKDGDAVEKDQTLLVLESDKATLDVPSPSAGIVSGWLLKVGDKVAKGTAVCTLAGTAPATAAAAVPAAAAPAANPPAAPVAAVSSAVAAKPAVVAAPPPAPASDGVPYASPSIRKFARELGVDLAKVPGSGPKGRITQEDVQGFVKTALAAPPPSAAPAGGGTTGGSGIPAIPAVDFSQFGEIEVKPLARIRKLSAAHLHRAWLNIPHVTQTDEADITELEAFRREASEESAKAGGPKLTLLPFVMKAMAKVLDAYPEFRASLSPDGESLIHKHYTHLGFAADTPNGLVVPVVRDVDRKTITQLAIETGELAKKARDGKLSGADIKGGVFSISSLGGIGGGHFTPIVNAPEVGILGVSKAVIKPVWDGAAFQPRLMVPLSLSYDHRVIDGAYAARTIVLLVKLLGDIRRLAL